MENMELYNSLRAVPSEAKKEIGAGRLKGFTDINPQWRIEQLTEKFGAVGKGWYYTIDKQWLEKGAGEAVAAFCNISLYYKAGDAWSNPVCGTGGSAFVAAERNGAYTSDECYKMALTDALSVAGKALGIGADVYFAKSRTKYDAAPEQPRREQETTPEQPKKNITKEQYEFLTNNLTPERIAKLCEVCNAAALSDLTFAQAEKAMGKIARERESA